MEGTNESMVQVRNAVKSFRSKKVLRSLSMTVKETSVYGLLGPSSCGKTTLLNCILGVKCLDSGMIKVKVTKSKDIGYMPQEVSLCENFTIKETCYFYGHFFGMEDKQINARMEELVDFLGLPTASRAINTFSGGQKRRVSFAVALFHDPPLLILDEPTVGMDCILSERIWGYLLKLANTGKTVIITTHYIQEAKHCKMIGLMRCGELLVEKSPDELMLLYNSTNLEDIFLEVCKKQEDLDYISIPEKLAPIQSYSDDLYPQNKFFDKHRFMALLNKNVLWLRRHLLAASGSIILPFLIVVLYGLVMGRNPKGINLALFSDEIPEENGLEVCDNITENYNEILNCSLPTLMTCTYVKELQKHDIHTILYKDYGFVAQDISLNKVWGSIEVPYNFTNSLINRIIYGLKTPDEYAESSVITSRIDGSNSIIKLILTNHLKNSIETLYNNILKTCGMPEKSKVVPLRYHDPIYGVNETAFAESALPGFICAFAFYFTLIYTTSAIMMEKVLGVLDRNTASGMTYFEIVIAHLIVQVCIMLVQNVIMMWVFYVVFGYPFDGNIWLAMFIILTVNFVGISFAFLLTEIFNKELSTAYASIGATVTVFTTGGMLWPQEGMHYALSYVVYMIPVAPVTRTLSSIVERDFSLTHNFIITGLVSNISWTLVFTCLTYILHKINRKL